jgi:hypothetical protein
MLSNYIYEVIIANTYYKFFSNINDATKYIINYNLYINNLRKRGEKNLEITIKYNSLIEKMLESRNNEIRMPISKEYKYKLEIQLLEFTDNHINYYRYRHKLNFSDYMSCLDSIYKFLLEINLGIIFIDIDRTISKILNGLSFILDINDFYTNKSYNIYFYFINNNILLTSPKIVDDIYNEYIERLPLNEYYKFVNNNYNYNLETNFSTLGV